MNQSTTTSVPSALPDPALRMTGVRKVYEMGDENVVALDGADLTVGRNEIIALLGPSGSGKTILCPIAGGLLGATEGDVLVGGNDITHYSARQLSELRRKDGRVRIPGGQRGPVPHRT